MIPEGTLLFDRRVPIPLRKGPTGHPIAPTEFPKGWSAAELVRPVKGDPETVACTPQEEDVVRQSHRPAPTDTDPDLPPDV